MTFDRVKQIYDKQWNKIMEAAIQKDAQPLYIADLAYSPTTESGQLSEVVGQAKETAFGGLVDQEDQGVEEMKGQEAQQEQHDNTEDPDFRQCTRQTMVMT